MKGLKLNENLFLSKISNESSLTRGGRKSVFLPRQPRIDRTWRKLKRALVSNWKKKRGLLPVVKNRVSWSNDPTFEGKGIPKKQAGRFGFQKVANATWFFVGFRKNLSSASSSSGYFSALALVGSNSCSRLRVQKLKIQLVSLRFSCFWIQTLKKHYFHYALRQKVGKSKAFFSFPDFAAGGHGSPREARAADETRFEIRAAAPRWIPASIPTNP